MKITSDRCKSLIAEWCQKHPDHIINQFTTSINPTLAFSEKNWKRIYKIKVRDGIEICFDCKPYDDQLRAIIVTDLKDENVTTLIVQGE